MSQEKLQTMIMQNVGGLKRCIMGFVQVENRHTASVARSVYSFSSTPYSTMIATGLVSNIICIIEIQNKPKVACTQFNRLFWVISSRFKLNFVIFLDYYRL